ncbi:F-box/kelch-repeat protein At2g44130-like [Macadamia integrifolia]|uniref:F-box/kelch-repeat protein At2g44130-like n=1 Tax=Macadamia integrifolia TaxID=60698 RepID=UPI001C52F9A8|nr:F-box/kelch-repeat protein At2g44130-like [Macadamia integrifolia]
MELIPGLPEEIGLECLTRLPYTAHQVATQVCSRWRELLESPAFYQLRKHSGNTHKVACLVQSLPAVSDGRKPTGPPPYRIAVFDPVSRNWERLEAIPSYPDGLPIFCRVSSVEGKLVVMGGWDPASWDPVKDVFVFDFTTRKWRRGKDMPSKRSFFAAGAVEGRVFVAGGHDESKNALRSAWAYDVRRDEWEELCSMREERDECEGLVVGNEFWVVSGYGTEHQGRFEKSAEVYELGLNRWRLVEEAWVGDRCPRGCVDLGRDGKLICWADANVAVGAGACAVGLGEKTLVAGSSQLGATQGLFLVENGGQNGKFEKIDVPDQFSGFIHSGCCVEI